jgi:hypothetical protein
MCEHAATEIDLGDGDGTVILDWWQTLDIRNPVVFTEPWKFKYYLYWVEGLEYRIWRRRFGKLPIPQTRGYHI